MRTDTPNTGAGAGRKDPFGGGKDQPGHGGDRPKDKFDGVTRLLIRDHVLDDSTEPTDNSLPVWLSPDLSIRPPGGNFGSTGKAGVSNDVKVRVTNLGGITATNSYVDLYACSPATGWTPATAEPVGNGFVTTPGYSAVDLVVPWTPNPAYGDHRCLMARVQNPAVGELIMNPTIFDVRGDRHVAQHNLHIVDADMAMKMGFGFLAVNMFRERMQFRVVARGLRPNDAVRRGLRGAVCPFAQTAAIAPTVELHAVDRGDALKVTLPNVFERPKKLEGVKSTVLKDFLARPGRGTATLGGRRGWAPDEVVRFHLTFKMPTRSRIGDFHIAEVAQFDMRGRLVGGLWVALVKGLDELT